MKHLDNLWLYKTKAIFYNSIYLLEGAHCLLCDCVLIHGGYKNYLCHSCYKALQDEIIDATIYHDDYEIRAFFEYKGCAKELIKMAKFNHSIMSCDLLINIVGDYMMQKNIITTGKDLYFIPTPCSYSSIKNRGWDITFKWAQFLTHLFETANIKKAILRNPFSFYLPQQKKLNRVWREQNIHARFCLNKKINLENLVLNDNAQFILLDDVMTTGATLLNNFSLLSGLVKKAFVLMVD